MEDEDEIYYALFVMHGERHKATGDGARAWAQYDELKRLSVKGLKAEMEGNGWIEWRGSLDCPVNPESEVKVRLVDGTIYVGRAGDFNWRPSAIPIKEYKILSVSNLSRDVQPDQDARENATVTE